MRKAISLLLILFSSLSFASFNFPEINLQQMSENEKNQLLEILKKNRGGEEVKNLQETYVELTEKCQKRPSLLCYQLESDLDHNLPNEFSHSHKKLLNNQNLENVEIVQGEFQQDLLAFNRKCKNHIVPYEKLYCKNLSKRILNNDQLLSQSYLMLEASIDNCEEPVSDLTEKITCSEKDKKSKDEKCSNEIGCVIASSISSTVILPLEALGIVASDCLNSQNSCLVNFFSSVAKSLTILVTSIWDLLEMSVDWSREKISQFWNNVVEVEDKTSDAQLMIAQMNENEIKEVKQSPTEWIKKNTNLLWQGIQNWMRTDLFCEKWEGIPRASQCLVPMKDFSCLSCKTRINSSCSVLGYAAGEIVPFFITGGVANVAERFSQFLKSTSSYQKMLEASENLKEVRAVKLLLTPGKFALNTSKNLFENLSQRFNKIKNSASYIKSKKALELAAKYSGIQFIGKLNNRAYELGHRSVDDIAKNLKRDSSGIDKLHSFERIEGYREDVDNIYRRGKKLREVEIEIEKLVQLSNPSSIEKTRLAELKKKVIKLNKDLNELNDQIITKLNDEYKSMGLATKLERGSDGSLSMILDLDHAPSNQKALEFYRRIKKKFNLKQVSLNLSQLGKDGAGASFSEEFGRIDVGPRQGYLLLEDALSISGKHEARHSMFSHMRAKGVDSIYHTKFYGSSDGRFLVGDSYKRFMSAEEIYNTSTEMQDFAKLLAKDPKANLIQIRDRAKALSEISTSTDRMIDYLLEGLAKNSFQIKLIPKVSSVSVKSSTNILISIRDKFGRKADIPILSPDLVNKFQVSTKYEQTKMIRSYLEQLQKVSRAQHGQVLKIQSLTVMLERQPENVQILKQLQEELWITSKNVREHYKRSILNK
ncbi:MAG: hypothetical protein AB7I27_12460 [Bacteriovoracaceae bacterium]